MFTRSDLATLLADPSPLAVSIFLPTHVRGSEVRQGPILLKNLTTRAHDDLMTAGISPADAEALLAPARALIDNYPFWQHQDHGLALFLGAGAARRYKVPIPLAEQVVVGPGFHIRPLLPILAADGAYRVLTITAGKVRLFEASRFAITEVENTGLPDNLGDELGEPDYENKVLAGADVRPHTGSINIRTAGRVAQGSARRVHPSGRHRHRTTDRRRPATGRAGRRRRKQRAIPEGKHAGYTIGRRHRGQPGGHGQPSTPRRHLPGDAATTGHGANACI
jgi:hypothetical protein